MDNNAYKNILKNFPVLSPSLDIMKLNGGLINDSFLIIDRINNQKFVFQNKSSVVFKNPEIILKNSVLVSHYIEEKLKNSSFDGEFQNINFYKTVSGDYFHKGKDNTYWCLTNYISNKIPETQNKLQLAFEAGKLLGYFHYLLFDMNISLIKETISGFHQLDKIFMKFKNITVSSNNRYNLSKDIYSQIMDLSFLVKEYENINKSGKIPYRIVHNDPKKSNFLFNDGFSAIALIDWDTIMPGYVISDTGDAIRSFANKIKEDERKIYDKIFDFDSYKSFFNGYYRYASKFITSVEFKYINRFILFITYEQTIRFYTDFLNYDKYYKTGYAQQNLVRSKVQLQLLKEMLESCNECEEYLSRLIL